MVDHAVRRPTADDMLRAIQEAIGRGDRPRQSLLVRQSADLLTKRWSRLPVEDKSAFDTLLAGLLVQADEAARLAFATRLAALRRPPPRTSALLAQDRSIRVAGHLLTHGRGFADDWFEALAKVCDDPHRTAIARRAALEAPLCDALLQLGDAGVAAALLSNPGATVTAASLPRLMHHAFTSEEVAVRLGARPDLPESYCPDLAELARKRAEAALAHDIEIAPEIAAALPDRIFAILAAPVEPERLARFEVSMAEAAGEPSVAPVRLERWLELRRIEDVLATLARHAGLTISSVVAAFDARDGTGLAVLLRGLDYPWSTLKALLSARFCGDIPLDTLVAAHNLMTNLAPGTARRLVRHAVARQGLSAYIAHLPD